MAWLKTQRYLILVCILFLISIVYINPVREVAVGDEWSYARMVKQLNETGVYHLDDWLAANPPVLIYAGEGFAKLFGYSLGVLRLSTLFFTFLGLLGCYELAKIHEFSDGEAGLLTLVLLASPLVLHMSFSFKTDVPCMAMLFVALYCYSRAVKYHDLRFALAGAVAAALAILIRQFGAALLLGWGLCWLLDSRRWRSRSLTLYLAGAILPAIALGWQLYVGTIQADWAARFVFYKLHAYLLGSPVNLALQSAWRIGIAGAYVALFVAPLALLVSFLYRDSYHRIALRRGVLITLCVSALAVLLIIYASVAFAGSTTLMPYLPWNFDVSVYAELLLSIVLFVASVLILPVVVKHLRTFFALHPYERLLDCVAVFSLLLILAFYKIGDEYMLVLLPFALITVGKVVKEGLTTHRRLLIGVCVASIVATTAWTRQGLAEAEAGWQSAEMLRASGIAPDQIAANYEWNSYYGAFDEYIASLGDQLTAGDAFGFFEEWFSEQRSRAPYSVIDNPLSTAGTILYSGTYLDGFFQRQPTFAIKKDG